jgi:PAS domain S-box-containing protein
MSGHVPSPAFYEALIDTSPLVVFRVSLDPLAVVYVSPNCGRVFGWEPDEVTGPDWRWADVIHADDLARADRELQRFLADPDEPATSTFRVLDPDGTERWVAGRLRGDPSDGADVFGFLLDIHDRVTSDREANRERELFQAVLDHASASIQVKDLDGRFLVANRRIETDFGLDPGALVGRTVHEIWPAEQADAFTANDRATIDAGEPIQVEEHADHPDGVHTYVSLKFPLVDADGEVFAVGGISTDITERTRIEDDLRRSEVFLDSIVENIPNMVFVKDADELRFVRFNRAGEELLGNDRADLLGKTDHDLFPVEQADAFVAADRAVLDRGRLHDIAEEEIDTAQGRRILHTRKIPVPGSDGRPAYLLGISEDITDRRSADDALRAAKEEAERADRAKSEFLSRMSHELRTPLNSILGFGQLLELEDLDESQAEAVGQILKGGRHLLDLINEVLDISRIESGTMTLSLEPVALDLMIVECLDLVRPQAQARDIELINLDGRHRHVHADRQRLKQVLLNLLSNAVKFNRDGGTITISCEHRDDDATIRVSDTGPGIREELLDRLFTPFDRLEADAAGIQGTGLGLALSRRLVEAMDGTIEVDSTPAVGSTFSVTLPIGQVEAAADDERRQPLAPSSEAPTTRTVLYVEDNLANLRLVERIIGRRPGVRLVSALQGSIGLELAAQHRPDLILLDVHLPDLGGDLVLQRLKADPTTSSIPVVIISADATARQIRRFRQLGADEYLTKPLDVAKFLDLLDDRLGLGSK